MYCRVFKDLVDIVVEVLGNYYVQDVKRVK